MHASKRYRYSKSVFKIRMWRKRIRNFYRKRIVYLVVSSSGSDELLSESPVLCHVLSESAWLLHVWWESPLPLTTTVLLHSRMLLAPLLLAVSTVLSLWPILAVAPPLLSFPAFSAVTSCRPLDLKQKSALPFWWMKNCNDRIIQKRYSNSKS